MVSSKETEKEPVCVLNASSYVGYWLLKGLLSRGYRVHAALLNNGENEIARKIWDMERWEDRLVVFAVDALDFQSIVGALKGCYALLCSLDNSDGYDEEMVEMEVRGAINVVEACAQTESIKKMVFTSSLAAAIWRENICLQKDVDERSWSDVQFCKKLKLWYALAKTVSEQAAWALAMDRALNMVSINAALVLGPDVARQNSRSTMSYLKGAAQMYENGVLASVDVNHLVDVHVRALENFASYGRYFCYDEILNTDEKAIQFAQKLSPLISIPVRYECEGTVEHIERLRSKKLKKLVEGGEDQD